MGKGGGGSSTTNTTTQNDTQVSVTSNVSGGPISIAVGADFLKPVAEAFLPISRGVEGGIQTLSNQAAGITNVTIRVKDSLGAVIYTTTKRVYAMDPLERYRLVKGVYLDLAERLTAGNIALAMRTTTTSADLIYRPIFTALGANLSSAASQLGEIASASVSDRSAQILVVRDGPQGKEGYFIQLLRNADGIWRIDSM